jgi:hypothetical protein
MAVLLPGTGETLPNLILQSAHRRVFFHNKALEFLRTGEGVTGAQGPAGADGLPGAGMVWMGAWSSVTLYLEGDGVERNGSSYIAVVENTNSAPPNANWDLIASKGAQGDQGIQGATGAQGIQGETGAAGAAGPNSISGTTTTTFTGLLKGNGSVVSAASAPTDYVATTDTRLSDARTPTAHTHPISEVTSLQTTLDGKEPANANIQAHIASAHAPATAEQNVNADWNAVSGDAQILNKPTLFAPSAHAVSHKSGETDAIKLDELAAPTDVTTLDASTAAHGLMKKYPGGTSTFLRADGAFAVPPAGAGGNTLFAPGSFTVATGNFQLHSSRLTLVTTNRMTLEGTGRFHILGR